MKQYKEYLLVLIILGGCLLAACAQGGSAANLNCSTGGEICITTQIVDTFPMGKPVPMKITVTSTKDIANLQVAIMMPTGAGTVEGPQNWEDFLSKASCGPGIADWIFDIKAGQTLTFNRVLDFPSHQEAGFSVISEVENVGRTIRAVDGFGVIITNDGGHVTRSGTPFPPYTPIITPLVYGPGTLAVVPTDLIRGHALPPLPTPVTIYRASPVATSSLTPDSTAALVTPQLTPLVATATLTLLVASSTATTTNPAYPAPSVSPTRNPSAYP